ncbi:MAG: hypothetical protein LBV17_03330, partial [Treponema sp.]|nr:hypothetical protein [Treponema sp.]
MNDQLPINDDAEKCAHGRKHEKSEYLTKQLITYIGNKRALLEFIGDGIKIAQKRLQKNKLKMF